MTRCARPRNSLPNSYATELTLLWVPLGPRESRENCFQNLSGRLILLQGNSGRMMSFVFLFLIATSTTALISSSFGKFIDYNFCKGWLLRGLAIKTPQIWKRSKRQLRVGLRL